MKEINQKDYDSKIVNKENAIIQFSASWCGPCRTLSPVLESIATENNLSVFKVDISENSQFAQDKGIYSIPYVELIKDGQVIEKFTGMMPKNKIEELTTNVYKT